MTESIVLCEGYHDRAFWSGLLLAVNCTDPGVKPGVSTRLPVRDIYSDPVEKGQYYFRTSRGNYVRVVPCRGKDEIPHQMKQFLNRRNTKPFACLIVNADTDADVSNTGNRSIPNRRIAIENLVKAADPHATVTPEGTLQIDNAATEVALVGWEAPDPVTPGLPNQQTLERLVCAAICGAYPERGQCVQNWLDARHLPPATTVKEYAWSHMAGWFSAHGCDDFYRCLWDDAAVANELQARLAASGAWTVIRKLAL